MPYDTIITPFGHWLDKIPYHQYPIVERKDYPDWLRNYFYTNSDAGGMMMMRDGDQYLPYQYDRDIGDRYIALNHYGDFNYDNIIQQLSMYHFLDDNEAQLNFPLSDTQRKMRSSFNGYPFNATLNGYEKFLMANLNGNMEAYEPRDEMRMLLQMIKDPDIYNQNFYQQ